MNAGSSLYDRLGTYWPVLGITRRAGSPPTVGSSRKITAACIDQVGAGASTAAVAGITHFD
jgi:hypothetical protein